MKKTLPFTQTGGTRSRPVYTIKSTGETFTFAQMRAIGPILGVRTKNPMDVIDAMTLKKGFTGKELAIKRLGTIVSVTLFSSPKTMAILRKNPPAGCETEEISRYKALLTLASEPKLDGVVLLNRILDRNLQ